MTTRNESAAPEALLYALQKAQSILVCPHALPDGDAIGSALALTAALEKMGKRVTLASADPVPPEFRFLPGADRVVGPDALEGARFDAAISVDASRLSRLGACEKYFRAAPVHLQIDHHATNTLFGHARWVDVYAAAAGCIVYRLIRALDVPVDADMAACLYCAISTDTSNFLSNGTTGEAFRIVAELVDCGLPLHDMARRLHLIKPEAQLRLISRALQTLRPFAGGKCVSAVLTPEDYAATGARVEHSFAVIDLLINMEGAEMAYLAYSPFPGTVRFSLRSRPPYDVSAIAEKMGGGGHVTAAGCEVKGDMTACCARMDAAMLQELEAAR